MGLLLWHLPGWSRWEVTLLWGHDRIAGSRCGARTSPEDRSQRRHTIRLWPVR